MGEGTVFSLFVSPHLDGGGVPQPGLDGGGGVGYSSQVLMVGVPQSGLDGRGVPWPDLDWGGVPQPGLDERGGRHASCVHAGGLSCCNGFSKQNSVLFQNIYLNT